MKWWGTRGRRAGRGDGRETGAGRGTARVPNRPGDTGEEAEP